MESAGGFTTGDPETDRMAQSGVRPDTFGWKEIAEVLGVPVRTAQRFDLEGLPVVSWGIGRVAAYRGRLMAWMVTRQRRAAA